MYAYEWDTKAGGYNLTPTIKPLDKEVRPVFLKNLNFSDWIKILAGNFQNQKSRFVRLKVDTIFIAVNL